MDNKTQPDKGLPSRVCPQPYSLRRQYNTNLEDRGPQGLHWKRKMFLGGRHGPGGRFRQGQQGQVQSMKSQEDRQHTLLPLSQMDRGDKGQG